MPRIEDAIKYINEYSKAHLYDEQTTLNAVGNCLEEMRNNYTIVFVQNDGLWCFSDVFTVILEVTLSRVFTTRH